MFCNLAKGKGRPSSHLSGNSRRFVFLTVVRGLTVHRIHFLHSHGSNGYVYLEHCYVAHTLPVVLRVLVIILPWVECLSNF